MEDERRSRIKRSLRSFLQLAWTLGVPDIRVRLMWRIAYTVLLGLIFFVANYIGFKTRLRFITSVGSKDARVYLLTEITMFVSFYLMIIVWLTKGTRAVHEAILDLAKVDDLRRNGGLTVAKNEDFRRLWVSLGSQLVIFFMMIVMHFNLNRESEGTGSSVLKTINYCCTSIQSVIQLTLFGILFSSIIRAIWFRCHCINDLLCRMGKACSDHSTSINESQRGFESFNRRRMLMVKNYDVGRLLGELDVLDEMHKQLCEITKKLTVTFSPCLLIVMTVVSLQCMTYAAFAILALDDEDNEKRFIIAESVLRIISNILQCWTMVSGCEDLSNEANRFGKMLHQIDVTDLRIRRKLREYSIKHYRKKLKITARGISCLNIPWLTHIIFTVTAYTIFIYQMNTTQGNIGKRVTQASGGIENVTCFLGLDEFCFDRPGSVAF